MVRAIINALFVIGFFAEVSGMILYCDHDIALYVCSGQQSRRYAEQIASIRLELFREFPYLYLGTVEEEYEYLSMYFDSPSATLVLGFDRENQLVCYSSSLAVDDCTDDIKLPCASLGYLNILYIGEVMLRSDYRSRGISRYCMAHHEALAREGGYDAVVFMTIDRSHDHPCAPVGYRPLDDLWIKYGYKRVTGVSVLQSWRQVDTQEYVSHTLSLWIKPINYTSDR